MVVKYVILLLLLIFPVSGQFLVVEDDVYTFSVLSNVKKYENGAPISDDTTTWDKAVQIREVNEENVTVRIDDAGVRSTKLIDTTQIGHEIAKANFTYWNTVEDDHNLLNISGYNIPSLTLSVSTVGNDFSITAAGNYEVEGVDYRTFFTIAYDISSGVRTLFTVSVRQEFNDQPIQILTYTESLSSTTDPFPKNDSKVPLMTLIIALTLLILPRFRKKIGK